VELVSLTVAKLAADGAGLVAKLTHIITSRHPEETWAEAFQRFHKIWPESIRSIVVRWREQGDQVKVQRFGARIKL
jgi:hypothetical protein